MCSLCMRCYRRPRLHPPSPQAEIVTTDDATPVALAALAPMALAAPEPLAAAPLVAAMEVAEVAPAPPVFDA